MRTRDLLPALFLVRCGAVAVEIGEKDIKFVDYPDFPEAHSTWGSIGYGSAVRKVVIGVTNQRDSVGLFEYDRQFPAGVRAAFAAAARAGGAGGRVRALTRWRQAVSLLLCI